MFVLHHRVHKSELQNYLFLRYVVLSLSAFWCTGVILPTPVHGKMAHKPSAAHSRARESQQMTPVHRFHLSCSEDSVTGITKSWEDIVLIVQTFVKGCKIDIHIRMHFLNGFDALRRCNKTHESD